MFNPQAIFREGAIVSHASGETPCHAVCIAAAAFVRPAAPESTGVFRSPCRKTAKI